MRIEVIPERPVVKQFWSVQGQHTVDADREPPLIASTGFTPGDAFERQMARREDAD